MISFLAWLESTPFSIWMRESPSVFAFPIILSLHTIGMGLVAGLNAVIGLRILGVGGGIPVVELKRFLPMMWFGFWLNAVSGVALLMAYPTKALTNPVFYLKLTLIAVALLLVGAIGRRVFGGPGSAEAAANGRAARLLAAASLACWAGAITSGRLLAYTYRHLMATL